MIILWNSEKTTVYCSDTETSFQGRASSLLQIFKYMKELQKLMKF